MSSVRIDLRPYIKPVHTSERANPPARPTELQRQIMAAFVAPINDAVKDMVAAMNQLGKSAAEAGPHMADVVRVARKSQTPPPWAGNISKQHRQKGNR